MTVRFYSSVAPPTTLTSTINSSATSITLASTTGLPGSFPFTLALDFGQVNEELVQVNNLGGLSATIVRAIDGTSATTHNAGAVVRHVSSARDFADSRNHENSTAGIHGLAPGSALVGTNDVQTLNNKTLGDPTINDATITGTVAGDITFSGINTFSDQAIFDGTGVFEDTVGTDPVLFIQTVGEANARAGWNANGTLLWSDGTAVADTNLYRSAANVLATDDKLHTGLGLDIQTTSADQINFKASTAGTGGVAMRLRDSTNASVWSVDDKGDTVAAGSTTTTGVIATNPSTVGGVDQGAGFQQFKVVPQVTIANTNETLLATTNAAINFLNGRAYRVSIWGYASSSSPDDYLYLRVRKGAGVAGTLYVDQMRISTLGLIILNVPVSLGPIIRNVSGSTVSTTLSLTAQSSTAGSGQTAQWSSNGGATSSYFYVEDIGLATDYQGFNLT